MPDQRYYISIDLKSFYASVECMERGLDPMKTNLVVADASRTAKTICLAVSPSLKALGIPGRPRLFEVVQKVRLANERRKSLAPERRFKGASSDEEELRQHPELSIDYIIARPRMAYYMEYSTRIYQIYLKYIAPEDIHVYSIDEVFIDVTSYLDTYRLTPMELAGKIIRDIRQTTGITATAGIGTNLYLSKIAMDIMAKHIRPDENGVRIACLDEMSYRRSLWDHQPITDFWRVGSGYAKKLAANGLYTMGDIARCSLGKEGEYHNAELLYKLFGINAELLIDHAWGYEPCTMADIKSYKPQTNSVGSSQVLQHPYTYEKAKLVIKEMIESLMLDLVDKGLITDQIVLTVGYDIENLTSEERASSYQGEIVIDRYGRRIPKHAHGTRNLTYTSSCRKATDAVLELYDEIINKDLLIRKITIYANHVISEEKQKETGRQLNLFEDFNLLEDGKEREKERKLQQAMLDIKKKFGKNAILKGRDLEEGATAMDRNRQIGGHRA